MLSRRRADANTGAVPAWDGVVGHAVALPARSHGPRHCSVISAWSRLGSSEQRLSLVIHDHLRSSRGQAGEMIEQRVVTDEAKSIAAFFS